MVKRFIVLGSTGSIGRSSLDVIAANGNEFEAVALTAHTSVDTLLEQAARFRPKSIALGDPDAADEAVRRSTGDYAIYSGPEGILDCIRDIEADGVINGLVGSSGMQPTMTALSTGKDVLLANKETMVMAGELVGEKARETGCRIIPIDSEMSAIYQCLKGENTTGVKRLVLTASGGPFVDYTVDRLASVTLNEALNHPTWAMGTKNTIDSATFMNKGLEVIEASHLFNMPPSAVDVTIHRSSVVHSFVEFVDGSLLCQLSKPDMRLAIQYAMTDPERLPSPYGGLDFDSPFTLTFEPPNRELFPCLDIAYAALERGGTAPAAMNGANEEAVEAFVAGTIGFADIPGLIRAVVDGHRYVVSPTIENLMETDLDAKRRIRELLT